MSFNIFPNILYIMKENKHIIIIIISYKNGTQLFRFSAVPLDHVCTLLMYLIFISQFCLKQFLFIHIFITLLHVYTTGPHSSINTSYFSSKLQHKSKKFFQSLQQLKQQSFWLAPLQLDIVCHIVEIDETLCHQ